MKRFAFGLFFLLACTKKDPPAPSPAVDAAPPTPDAKAIVTSACLSCHTTEMLAQQRLPKERWAATVKKMVGWGATLDPSETEPLVTYLAATYGPDAGPYEPSTIAPAAAANAIAPLSDGAYAGGDAENGKALYVDRCSGCHGNDARGHIGVNLVERPLLYRAADVAVAVRRGRGKMTPMPKTTDREIADVLAYLRTLRVP